MKSNVYEDAAALVNMLRAQELFDFAEDIDDALHGGSTGTEVLMALRWQTQKMIDSGCCSELCLARAKKLVEDISVLIG